MELLNKNSKIANFYSYFVLTVQIKTKSHMHKKTHTVMGLVAVLALFSFIPSAQAELSEFVIELNIEKDIIYEGETVVVTGRVIDHAYEPTRGVEVFVRTGSDTAKTFTDTKGFFTVEFEDFQGIPGTYTVNVAASWYGMRGLASTQFQVNGDGTPSSALQEKLSTKEAQKYLSAEESDFEKNPVGQILFRYYHGLHDELIQQNKESAKLSDEEIHIKQQREIAEKLRMADIALFSLDMRILEDDDSYEHYISGLNPQIRDLVAYQLNFTRNNVIEAQILRDEIIANGGTYEQARQAYLEMISIPKQVLEEFNEKYQKAEKHVD